MAAYKQLVAPRKNTQAGIGWCLAFAQSFFGAPVKHASAWEAWQATARKQTGPLPSGAAVLVWFSHYGTYQGRYANWGHVAIYVPDDAYYSSPATKSYGQDRYRTIAEMERAFNAKYVGWTDNINGLRVAEPVTANKPAGTAYIHPQITIDKEEETMKLWIAEINGGWYLVVPTGAGKPNAVVLPGNSGMGGGGAAKAGIPVISLSSFASLKKVANV